MTSGLTRFVGTDQVLSIISFFLWKAVFFFLGLVGMTNLSAIDSEVAFSSSGWKCCLYRGLGWEISAFEKPKAKPILNSCPLWCIRSNTFWCERYFCDKVVIEEAAEKWNFPNLQFPDLNSKCLRMIKLLERIHFMLMQRPERLNLRHSSFIFWSF